MGTTTLKVNVSQTFVLSLLECVVEPFGLGIILRITALAGHKSIHLRLVVGLLAESCKAAQQ